MGRGSASLSLGKRKAATSTIRVVLNDKMAAGHLAPYPASVSTTPELVSSSSSVFSWNENSRLALTDVQVRHDDEGPYSLKDVTFHITGLGKIGIIGASGAGKSTLIDVLAGFQLPTSGQVLANGQPVTQDMLESWRIQTAAIRSIRIFSVEAWPITFVSTCRRLRMRKWPRPLAQLD